MMQWGPYMGGYGYGMGWFGGIMMIAFWALLIVGLVYLIRAMVGRERGGGEPGRPDSAADILRKRYARGEIDKKDFEEKMRDISGS
jgi:putative membrane protein